MTVMLDRRAKSAIATPVSSPQLSPGIEDIGLSEILAFLRRQRTPIALCVGAFLLLGAIYLVVTPEKYTATASLLIDTRKLQIFGAGDVFQEASLSNSAVETQVGILVSGRIAEAVVNALDLSQNREFLNSNWSPTSAIKGQISAILSSLVPDPPDPPSPAGPSDQASPAPSPDGPTLRAMGVLQSNLSVGRAGLSYIISVSYTSTDPQLAARIANGVVSAYLEDQVNAQANTAQRASRWLQARIVELRDQSSEEGLTAREKSAIRSTYDSFLQRYTETVQQQSLPMTEARPITTAIPGGKSSPNTLLVIAGSLLAGGAMGFGLALARDLLDRTMRTKQRLESVTGVACLGLLPTFDLSGRAIRRLVRQSKKMIDPSKRKFAAGPAYSVVLNAPLSRFAETLRSIKVAAETAPTGPVPVLGVVSSVSREGKTTVAINLARLIAQEGGRVLLIDGDLRDPVLSQNIVSPEAPGLIQTVSGRAHLGEVIWSDSATRLQFLPAGTGPGAGQGNGLLGAHGTQAIIEACRDYYDTIIFDLPAVLPVVDVRAVAHLFDGFVFVVEWGRTTEDVLAQAFRVGGIGERVIGTVFNKVDLSTLQRFDDGSAQIPAGKYLKSYRYIG